MSCCFEPGRLIFQPDPPDTIALAFEREILRREDILYSVEDVLRHYRLLDGVESKDRGHLHTTFPSFPMLVRVPIGREIEFAERLGAINNTLAAVPNYHVQPSGQGVVFNESFLSTCCGDIGVEPVDPACGRGVSVAILDSGVDAQVVARYTPTPPAVQFDTDVARPIGNLAPYDPSGHGTVVASLIQRGAPGATIVPVKVMRERGTLIGVIAGLYVAIAAARPQLFNLSLSLTCDTGVCAVCGRVASGPAGTMEQLARLFSQVDTIYAVNGSHAPVIVAAAGNVRGESPLTAPASFANVLAVGASSLSHQISSYSEYLEVPVSRFVRAPGGEDRDSEQFALVSKAGKDDALWKPKRSFGTSFAAALVTAVAARYLCALNPGAPCTHGPIQRQGPAPRSSKRGLSSTTAAVPPSPREFVLRCLSKSAYRDFSSFSSTKFGLGIARYHRSLAHQEATLVS